MTEAFISHASTSLAEAPQDKHETVPLVSGYLVAESARAVSVRVDEGTWTFDRADVLGIDSLGAGAPGAELPGATRERSGGDSLTREFTRPVRVRIRRGATADFTRRMRIDLAERPMTLGQQHSPARGDELLTRQTERWAHDLRLSAGPGSGATMTRCQTRSLLRGVAFGDDAMACDNLD